MAKKEGLSLFPAIVRAEKEQRALDPATALCPDNGTLPALRSLLSVALSSVRVRRFYHVGTLGNWSVFRCEFLTSKCPSGRFFVINVVGFSIDKYNRQDTNLRIPTLHHVEQV